MTKVTSCNVLLVELMDSTLLLSSTRISKRSTPLELDVAPVDRPPITKSPPVLPRPTSSRMTLAVTFSVELVATVLMLVCKPETGGTKPLEVAKPAAGLVVKTPPPVSVNTMVVPLTAWPDCVSKRVNSAPNVTEKFASRGWVAFNTVICASMAARKSA